MDDQRSLKCDECGRLDHFILHTIPHFHNLRRFCTACVLKSSPGSYCAVCFRLFDTPLPPPPERAMCFTCHSISHLSCALSGHGRSSVLYHCLHCKNPSLTSFDLKFHAKGDQIDLESAAKLFSAASIASASMKRAAVAAREEAAKKVRDVVVAKRNVKEALERLANVSEGSPTAADGTRRGSEDPERASAMAGVVGESSQNANAASNKY